MDGRKGDWGGMDCCFSNSAIAGWVILDSLDVCGGVCGGVVWSTRLLPAFRLREDFGRDGEVQGSHGLFDMDVLGVMAMEDQGEDWQASNRATTESLGWGRTPPVVNTGR